MPFHKIITWIGRVLGLAMLAALAWAIIYAVVMLKPESETNIGNIFLIMVSVLLMIFLLIFLVVAWRKEITGATLYLVFAAILELLVLSMNLTDTRPIYFVYLYLIGAPIALDGILFLTGGLVKAHRAKAEKTGAAEQKPGGDHSVG